MPPKGKQGTKGGKQIVEENEETLSFYLKIIACVDVVYLVVTVIFFWHSFTLSSQFFFSLCNLIYYLAYKFMRSMAKTTPYPLDPSTPLIDPGTDLNMNDGMAEHLKDLLLLTSGIQLLSLLSTYFFFFLLLIPARALFLLWVNFLGPWFFQEAPEVDEKKNKKMERKMKRMK